MNNINLSLSILFCAISFVLRAQTPTPPSGKKWQKVEALSDEFNDTSLNTSKWAINNPNWIGRPPGIFKRNAVKVRNGKLEFTAYKLSSPETVRGDVFTHGGAFVRSLKNQTYGYYECRMKANKTFMSSTFWLINDTRDTSGCDKRTTELDITETVGVNSNGANWVNAAISNMGSNTHSRNTACNSTPVGSVGDKAPLGGKSWEKFHVYGAWWKSKDEIRFYLDGKFVYKIKPKAGFNLPMYLRMVTETYDWNPPKQGKDGMRGSAKDRTTSYDWVRTYKLVNDNSNSTVNKVEFTNRTTTLSSAKKYTFKVKYTASQNRDIVVSFWKDNNWVANKLVKVSKGSGTRNITVDLPSVTSPGTNYMYRCEIRPVGASWQQALDNDQVRNIRVRQRQIIANGTYFITSSANNQRLLSRAPENHNAIMHSPANFNDQRWVFTHISNDVYTIMNKGTKRYLEVPFAACNNSINVATSTDTNDTHKRWKIVRNGNGIYGIKPNHCLAKGLDRSNGLIDANVQIWDYNSSNNNQKWRIIEDNGTSAKSALTITREVSAISEDLIVYPNPVIEILNLKNLNENADILIFDFRGRTVIRETLLKTTSSNKAIDVTGLDKGLYFISVNGGSKLTKFFKD